MTIEWGKFNIPGKKSFSQSNFAKNLEELTLKNILVFAGAVALELID